MCMRWEREEEKVSKGLFAERKGEAPWLPGGGVVECVTTWWPGLWGLESTSRLPRFSHI